jgi:hypothetical protein
MTGLLAKVLKSVPNIDLSEFHLVSSFDIFYNLHHSCCYFKDDWKFIALSPLLWDLTQYDLMFTFLHEIRHAYQFMRGRLIHTSDNRLYYNGELVLNGNAKWPEPTEYAILPHEYDANLFAMESPLICSHLSECSYAKEYIEAVLKEKERKKYLDKQKEFI